MSEETDVVEQRPDVIVRVRLPGKVWEVVERIALADRCSRTEALRRCISEAAYRRQVEAEGETLAVKRLDGSLDLLRWPR